MLALNVTIALSDLFEQADAEGGLVAQLIDEEIMPLVRHGLNERTIEIGLGDRFNRVIEKVRLSADRTGKDRTRTLKDMLKSALTTYVRKTHDAMTARGAYHHSIMSGSDTMLAVAAAAILANALCGSHTKEAQSLMQKVLSKLSGLQKLAKLPAMENASGAASGAGAIATVATGKKKRRKDSIFAEAETNVVPRQSDSVHSLQMSEADVIPFPGARQPVHNPELSQADDVSNVYLARPQARRPSNLFFAVLYTPREGEQEFDGADLANVKELAKAFNLSKYDRANRMFYQPGSSAADVATLHVFHPDRSPLSPVEAARLQSEVFNYLQMAESLDWDDLIGNPTAMDVLNEVNRSGTPRRHDGVLVDPTTAELVLSVHRSLTPENQQRYQEKTIARMIEIAERAVQRGLIEVSMEEA